MLIFLLIAWILFLFALLILGIWAYQSAWDPRFYPKHAIIHCKDFKAIPSTTKNKTLKILSYNMGYASAEKNNLGCVLSQKEIQQNLESIQQSIAEHSPEIVLLQEVDFFSKRSHFICQLYQLAQNLHYPYLAYTLTWNKRYVAWPLWKPTKYFGKLVSGQAILSRYPILWQHTHTFPKPQKNPFWFNAFYLDRSLQQIDIKTPQGNLSIYHIHLEAFEEETRLQQLKGVQEKMNSDSSTHKIIGGDFNIDLNQDLKNQQALKKFSNLSTMQHFTGFSIHNTFPSWQPQKALDHLFFSDAFKIERSEVLLEAKGSDHVPVLLTLGF